MWVWEYAIKCTLTCLIKFKNRDSSFEITGEKVEDLNLDAMYTVYYGCVRLFCDCLLF